MADAQKNRRQPSRLQRRAPASIQINPVSTWNVAIPLLSPLTSPTASPKVVDRTVEMKPREDSATAMTRQGTEADKVVFKKWQHPAAPFCYDPQQQQRRVRPFVPV